MENSKDVSDIGDIVMEHEVNNDRFINALIGNDEVGALVRCHYEAERAINHVLNRMSGGRSRREVENWQSFAQKLEVCRVLGVHDDYVAPLKTLNKHRNDLAHKGRETLTDQEVLDMFRQVAVAYPRYSEDFHMEVAGKEPFDKRYGECTNKEKYVISCILAVSMLSVIPQLVAKARAE